MPKTVTRSTRTTVTVRRSLRKTPARRRATPQKRSHESDESFSGGSPSEESSFASSTSESSQSSATESSQSSATQSSQSFARTSEGEIVAERGVQANQDGSSSSDEGSGSGEDASSEAVSQTLSSEEGGLEDQGLECVRACLERSPQRLHRFLTDRYLRPLATFGQGHQGWNQAIASAAQLSLWSVAVDTAGQDHDECWFCRTQRTRTHLVRATGTPQVLGRAGECCATRFNVVSLALQLWRDALRAMSPERAPAPSDDTVRSFADRLGALEEANNRLSFYRKSSEKS